MRNFAFFFLIVFSSCAKTESVQAPYGMQYIPKGKSIAAFFMDESPVTVAQFRSFVESTEYITEAEKFGNSAVFSIEKNWFLQEGANWQYPTGSNGFIAIDDHPVTQVSYNDALAYCDWAGKRLPTQAEWEYAAKDAKDVNTIYNWGDNLIVEGKYMANTWQGSFPYINTAKDGFEYTSPVGHFGKTKLGLTDMAGNVWEWTSDWDLPKGMEMENFQPNEQSQKVLKGGSFLCEPSFCHGYQITGKSESTIETGLMHTGFRCVKDI
jgi:sulfatase modifying factor 1